MPEEVLQASQDLNAKRMFPIHSGKFSLAQHPWNEPLASISELNQDLGLNLVTPRIGEVVYLDNDLQEFENWWEGVK